MFALDDDPRYQGIDARIATRADVHVALGGDEDKCGSGFLSVDAKSHLTDVSLFGERFAQGDADVAVRWYDRAQGITGAEVDLRSFVLDEGATARRNARGGVGYRARLGGHPARRCADGQRDDRERPDVAPRRAGIARVGCRRRHLGRRAGRGQPRRLPTGREPRGDHAARRRRRARAASPPAAIAPERAADAAVPAAEARDGAHQVRRDRSRPRSTRRPTWPTLRRTASGTSTAPCSATRCRLSDVVVTRAKAPHVSGRASLRGLDLGALGRIYAGHKSEGDEAAPGSPAAPSIGGQLWAEVMADDVPLDAPSTARARVLLGPTVVERGGQKLTLRPPATPLVLEGDTLTLPALEVTLDTPDGFQGGFVVTGSVARVTTEPDAGTRRPAQSSGPGGDRTPRPEGGPGERLHRGQHQGDGQGHRARDRRAADGQGRRRSRSTACRAPSPTCRVDVHASATEVSARGAAKFAGGTVDLRASVPVKGFEIGALDSHITARGLRMTPTDGVATTFDADLDVAYDSKASGAGAASLPRVTGDVTLESLDYTRPISLTTDLSQLGGRAKRTQVDAYDPSLDVVAFDVRVRSRRPIVIKNNLVEVQLAIDSGSARDHGHQPAHGPARRPQDAAGRSLPLPVQRLRRATGPHPVRRPDAASTPNVDITAVTEYRRYTDTRRRGRRPARARQAPPRRRPRARRAAARCGASRCTPTATRTTCAST